MVEVRNITNTENPPENADWVLIQKTTGGKYAASGSVAGKRDATFFTPRPYDTVAEAIRASKAWCETNDVPVVYVKDIPNA